MAMNTTDKTTIPSLDRRAFLSRSVGGLAGAALVASDAEAFTLARPAREISPDAVGILYDSTVCIGCKLCVAACAAAHKLPVAAAKPGEPDELTGRRLSVIKKYVYGTGKTKDTDTDGYAFLKRQCLHCVDPTCVSVCPNSAMQKDPVTGIVTNDPDACMGCRFCTYACPEGVPQFDLSQAYGRINKCDMCVGLQRQGKIPACADVCPSGATLFGRVADLQAEADRRLSLAPGTPYVFPGGRLGDPHVREHPGRIAEYQPRTYGLKEGGGTQVRYLAGVPFAKLGLPELSSRSPASLSEGIQHTLYHRFAAPIALFTAFLGLAFRSTRNHRPADEPGE